MKRKLVDWIVKTISILVLYLYKCYDALLYRETQWSNHEILPGKKTSVIQSTGSLTGLLTKLTVEDEDSKPV